MRVFREIFALGGIFRLPHRLQTALLDAIDPLRASAIRAGARGGARAGKHRCVRILAITAGSSMAAMILKSPPHCGQCSRSIPKTRLSRREHAVKTDQMQARSRHQRGQALHEFQRRHLDVRSAVAPGALELQHDITSATAYPSMQA